CASLSPDSYSSSIDSW
nr:immunoglobulin heavy chain junction region [Macaca mulatta]